MTYTKIYNAQDYVAHIRKHVQIKVEEQTGYSIGGAKTYARGDGREEFFPCRFDSHGNICDADGIVVFPSESGKYPAVVGDLGYFGHFRENYGDGVRPDLPSANDPIYRRKED